MALYRNTPTFKAGANINPAVFCKLDTTAAYQIVQAGAGELAPFISQRGSKYAPGLSGSTTLVAESGDTGVQVFGQGEVTFLTAGSGGFVQGDKLKSDANGFGITTVTAADIYNAIALETAASGQVGSVLIVNGKV